MTDHRPQYGEIATAEEQRIAAGLPPLDEQPPTPSEQPKDAVDGRPAPSASASGNRVDRIVTIVLLAYGLVNVIVTGLSYLDFSTVMNEAMKTLGIEGEFTNFAQGKVWGTVAAIVLVVGWSLTATLSVRRLRRGRLTWWVPILGAVVTLLITSFCVAVPMMSDPAFLEYMARMTGV